jgi:hypothetical protein
MSVRRKNTLARLASGFLFLLAKPEFYSHLASWRVVIRTHTNDSAVECYSSVTSKIPCFIDLVSFHLLSCQAKLRQLIFYYLFDFINLFIFATRCAPGYYGNPLAPGGMCRKCNCGGNIDPTIPGSCDPVSGACVICTNNTEGEYCERCKPGYFGSAVSGDCRRKLMCGPAMTAHGSLGPVNKKS